MSHPSSARPPRSLARRVTAIVEGLVLLEGDPAPEPSTGPAGRIVWPPSASKCGGCSHRRP